MGMAASQVRLLGITSRKHDLELKAQNIQSAKLILATQSDAVYEEYQKALDETTLTVQSIDSAGNKSTLPVTFNNLFSKDKINIASGDNFMLIDKNGRLVVEEDIAEGYEEFKDDTNWPQTAQMFAMFMLGCEAIILNPHEEFVEENPMQPVFGNGNTIGNDISMPVFTLTMTPYDIESGFVNEENVASAYNNLYTFMNDWSDKENIEKIYDTERLYNEGTPEQIAEYKKLLNIYLNELYKYHAEDIYKRFNGNSDEGWDHELFNYYVNIYNAIQLSGGEYISIEEFDGMNIDAANNGDWLKAMIECGMLSISILEKDKEGNYFLDTTSISTEGSLCYTTTTTIDKTALAKAETKYEQDLKQIDRKDEKFDLELSKIETEKKALDTQYDSVKELINKNIEKTFNIFS